MYIIIDSYFVSMKKKNFGETEEQSGQLLEMKGSSVGV